MSSLFIMIGLGAAGVAILVAALWRRGSVISSWLLDLTSMALAENPTLAEYTGFVSGYVGSGSSRMTVPAFARMSAWASALARPARPA